MLVSWYAVLANRPPRMPVRCVPSRFSITGILTLGYIQLYWYAGGSLAPGIARFCNHLTRSSGDCISGPLLFGIWLGYITSIA